MIFRQPLFVSPKSNFMNFISRSLGLLLATCMWFAATETAIAQLDRVYDKAGNNVSGTVVQTSAASFQVRIDPPRVHGPGRRCAER